MRPSQKILKGLNKSQFFSTFFLIIFVSGEMSTFLSLCLSDDPLYWQDEYFYGYKQAYRREDDIATGNPGNAGIIVVLSVYLCKNSIVRISISMVTRKHTGEKMIWQQLMLV